MVKIKAFILLLLSLAFLIMFSFWLGTRSEKPRLLLSWNYDLASAPLEQDVVVVFQVYRFQTIYADIVHLNSDDKFESHDLDGKSLVRNDMFIAWRPMP